MHFVLLFSILLISFWKGDWKHWQKYALTIQYVIICNLLYNMLCHDYLLWEYKPDFLQNHTHVDVMYTFIILPIITLMFLSNYPFSEPISKQIRYIAYWVIASLLLEYIFLKFEKLVLKHGYEYWMEFLFYPIMYSMIRLHYSRPLITYIISVFITIFMLWYFKVPIK